MTGALGRVYAIALNTFREAIRNRVLYAILVLVLGANLFGIVLGAMSLHEEARLARDVGLGAVSLFGSMTAIILGVVLLHGEVQRRTIHNIVSKPVERWEFVLGKYAGMGLTLTLLVLAFAAAMGLLLVVQEVPLTDAIVKALLLSWVEVLVVAAIALFFSSFSSPYLSGAFTFGIFLAGRFTPEMRQAVETSSAGAARFFGEAALTVLPDLHLYSVSGREVGGEHVSVHGEHFVGWDYVATAGGYGLLAVAILIALAALIFSRRDFA